MRVNKIALALGLTSVITIVGCDSGGSSSSSATSPSTPSTPTTYSVKAIDGYLRNAKVWLDINRDFLHDEATEPSAVTGEGGVAELDVSDIEDYQDYQIVVHAIAGETIDEDTIDTANPAGQVMSGSMVMSAPAGESNITPLSSFVNVIMNKNPNALNDPTQREELKKNAVEEVANQLGISPDALLDDYLDDETKDPQAAFAAQSIVKSKQVLPESPEEMAGLAQDVQSAGDSASEDVPQLMLAEAINGKIKEVVDKTDEDDLADTPAPVTPPADDTPPVDDDSDSIPNDLDAFPNNSDEWLDSDKDNMGNNQDAFPYDASEQHDSDLDGKGDNADLDDDNDGFADDIDEDRLNPNIAGDHDSDGIDSVDDEFPFDHDNDGYPDDVDAFDDDPTEWVDSDGDTIGNNADDDDDNDTVLDANDLFPLDDSKAGDPDEDGIDTISDVYPYDHDNDGYNDDVDAFDDDPTEWVDSDGDTIGNNADDDDDNDTVLDVNDLFPLDDTLAGDPDGDGIDTLVDAFPQDANKSVADQTFSNSALIPVLNINHREVMLLNVDVQKTIETFNDDTRTTTSQWRYVSEDGVEYGYKESIDIQDGTEFTRIENFRFDFNLDGDAQFIGRLFDIGTRSANTEVYWRYVDESDATPEGGVNGDTPRVFDNTNFSARVHLTDLTNIDTIQHFDVTIDENVDGVTYLTNMNQYVVNGFDAANGIDQPKDYASHNVTTEKDFIAISVIDNQDWGADGSINTTLRLESGLNDSYQLSVNRPVWANPEDGIHEEFADFNYTPNNWDNLTSYWYEYQAEYNADGNVLESGQRYVLNDATNSKLLDDTHSNGYLFHEWQMLSRNVSDNERNEHVSWTHYPLDDYSFTASQLDVGQAYRIYTHQIDDIWSTLSFDEWGSNNVANLDDQIENARSGGTFMYDIDKSVVPGLSRYAAQLPNATFQYHDDGTPRQWYAVSQDPLITDGTPSLVPLTLSEDGVIPNSYVVSNGPDLILVAPYGDAPASWFTDYYRLRIDMYGIDMDPNSFNWTTNIGQLFINQSDAQTRLDDMLDPTYRVCSSENTGELSPAVDSYWNFLPAANNCGYIGIDASYVNGLTLYYQEDAQNYSSYQFTSYNSSTNSGSGTYRESDGYSNQFSWIINEFGIININSDGDSEYLAYIAHENGVYSFLAFFEWDEDTVPYSEIIGMAFTTTEPSINSGEYKVCFDGDTLWDDVNDKPASSPQYTDLEAAVSSCGGSIELTSDIMANLEWHDYNADKDRHKIWAFNSDGTVTKTKNGVVSGPYTWIIDHNGYLKIIYNENTPDDFIIMALIATDSDRYSLKALDSYLEDGQTEYWSEIVTEEFVTTNPNDKVGVITALHSGVNWFSPWAEWNEGDQKDYLHLDHVDITQADLLSWTESSIVESDKTLTSIEIADDADVVLTDSGWKPAIGFEFDLSNSNIVAKSPTAPSLTHTIIYAAVHDKSGGNIAQEAPGEWAHYSSNSVLYPSGSQVVALTMRNDQNSYTLFESRPYMVRSDAGVDSDSDIVSSPDEMFVTTSVGNDIACDLLHASSFALDLGLELVRPTGSESSGAAHYYSLDFQVNNQAIRIDSGTWEIRLLNGEELVLFEIPQSILESYDIGLDGNTMFYSVYRSQTGGDDFVHVGEFVEERSEQEEVYLFNVTAKDAIIDAADIP